MKLQAKKMGTIKSLKDSLKKGGSSGGGVTYIKNIPADGISVRFLTEPEEWFGYYEYWDDSAKTFVPMVEGEILPDGAKPSFRYLSNALDIANDRVIPLKLAKTVANVLILKYDKYNTMTDRNYDLQKHGEGLDTTYDVTPDAPARMNVAKYDLLDLEKVLVGARAQATGEAQVDIDVPVDDDDDEDADDTPAPPAKSKPTPATKKARVASGSAKSYTDDELFPNGEYRIDYSREELVFISTKKESDFIELMEFWELQDTDGIDDILVAQAENAALPDEDEDSDEDEDTDDDASDDDDAEEQEYDIDDLKKMTVKALRLIAEDMEIDHDGVSKDDLIDLIIEAAEA